MKKTFALILMAIVAAAVLSSCEKGTQPNESIGLAAGFAYCSGFASYWIVGIIVTLIAGACMYFYYSKTNNPKNWPLFIALVVVALVWIYSPAEVAWNTTVEQAARGVYIR